MTDLNTAIVDFLGWKSQPDEFGGGHSWFQYDKSGKLLDIQEWRPDYEHDARLYMALYFELPVGDRVHLAESCTLESFGHYVCLCFCKLKGIEVVG